MGVHHIRILICAVGHEIMQADISGGIFCLGCFLGCFGSGPFFTRTKAVVSAGGGFFRLGGIFLGLFCLLRDIRGPFDFLTGWSVPALVCIPELICGGCPP